MNTIKVYLNESGSLARLEKNFPLIQHQFQNVLLNVYVPKEILSPIFELQNFVGQVSDNVVLTDSEYQAYMTMFVGTKLQRNPQNSDTIYYVDNSGDTTKLYIATYNDGTWSKEEVSHLNYPTINGTTVEIGVTSTALNGRVVKSKGYAMRYVKDVAVNGTTYAMYERKLPKAFTTYYGVANNQMVINVFNIESEKVASIITSQSCSYEVLQSTILDQDEVVDPTEMQTLTATVNSLQAVVNEKQNIHDELLITDEKTVVGAINELSSKIATELAENLPERVSANESAINRLETIVGTGEDYIGTMRVQNALPTDTQLDDFVFNETMRARKGGDTIIVVLEVAGGTDKNYKYIFSGEADSWSSYEIPPMEKASNGTAGIIQGTYGIATESGNLLVDIVGGKIVEVYIKRLGTYVPLSATYGNALTSISNIINGTQTVGKALSSTNDSEGNNIAQTYQTKELGATKQYVKDYALPNTFNDTLYMRRKENSTLYEFTNETLATAGAWTYAPSLGSTPLIDASYVLNDLKFQLSKNNQFYFKFYASLSATETVYFRVGVLANIRGEGYVVLANVITTPTQMQSGVLQPIVVNGNFDNLALPKVAKLSEGDSIVVRVAIVRDSSSINFLTIVSNQTFPSTFNLSTIAKVIDIEEGVMGQYHIITTEVPTEISGNNVAMFELDAALTGDTQYLFIVPQNAQLDTTKPFYLQKDEILYEVITPYSVNTALLSMLEQTKTASGNYRIMVTFKDEKFYVEQSNLSECLSLVELSFDGTHIYNGETIMTYQDIADLCNDKSKFLYLYDRGDGVVLLPQAEDGYMVEFMGHYWLEGATWSVRIIINDQEQVRFDEHQLANQSDLENETDLIRQDILGIKDDVSQLQSEKMGRVVITANGTMTTSTLPAIQVPSLTATDITTIIDNFVDHLVIVGNIALGQFIVTEIDEENNGVRFNYYGAYLDYYAEGDNVVCEYIKLGGGGSTGSTSRLTGATQTLSMVADTYYICTTALTSLTINSFTSNGGNPLWEIKFKTGSTFNASFPNSMNWVNGTPVFEADTEYTIYIEECIEVGKYDAYITEK